MTPLRKLVVGLHTEIPVSPNICGQISVLPTSGYFELFYSQEKVIFYMY